MERGKKRDKGKEEKREKRERGNVKKMYGRAKRTKLKRTKPKIMMFSI